MQPSKRKGLIQVKLRIPKELKRKLDREVKKRTDGSLSAEIAERLERSFTWPKIEEATASAVVTELKARGFVNLTEEEWRVLREEKARDSHT